MWCRLRRVLVTRRTQSESQVSLIAYTNNMTTDLHLVAPLPKDLRGSEVFPTGSTRQPEKYFLMVRSEEQISLFFDASPNTSRSVAVMMAMYPHLACFARPFHGHRKPRKTWSVSTLLPLQPQMIRKRSLAIYGLLRNLVSLSSDDPFQKLHGSRGSCMMHHVQCQKPSLPLFSTEL